MTTNKQLARDLVHAEWNIRENAALEKGEVLVHDDQKAFATKIFDAFVAGVCVVSLIASCQMGKTGTALYLMKLMTMNPDDNFVIHPDNVFFITGMSDVEWKKQTKKRMLRCFANVYHRNDLRRMLPKIRGKKNCLIVLDECHMANERGMTLHHVLKESGVWDVNYMRENNIKILCVSATPAHVLIDAQGWGEANHKTIVMKNTDGSYTGFQHLIDEDRIRGANLRNEDDVREMLETIERRWPRTPKYHIIRASEKTLVESVLKELIAEYGYAWTAHDSKKRIADADKMLARPPARHTFVLIKAFYRAAKTLNDANIGICLEDAKDESAHVQGLPGRLLGYGRRRGPQGPLLYCDIDVILEYVAWLENGADYAGCERYDSRTLKIKDGRVKHKAESTLLAEEVNLVVEGEAEKKPEMVAPKRVGTVRRVPDDAVLATTYDEMTETAFKDYFDLAKIPKTAVALGNQLRKNGFQVNVSCKEKSARDASTLHNYFTEWIDKNSEYHVIKLAKNDWYSVIRKNKAVPMTVRAKN